VKCIICPDCGAHLDFGEKCDCRQEREKREQEYKQSMPPLKTEKGGQLSWIELSA